MVTITVPTESNLPRLEELSFQLHDLHHQSEPEHFKTAEGNIERKRY